MKILIIEDDPSLREMLAITVAQRLEPKFRLAEMEGLNHVVRYFVGEHTLLLAETLDDALRMIPEADAVLCDGTFPSSARPIGIYGGLRQNWPFVLGATAKRGIPFALLSGDDALVERAKTQWKLVRMTGIAAFVKGGEGATSAIDWLFEQLAGPVVGLDETAA